MCKNNKIYQLPIARKVNQQLKSLIKEHQTLNFIKEKIQIQQRAHEHKKRHKSKIDKRTKKNRVVGTRN